MIYVVRLLFSKKNTNVEFPMISNEKKVYTLLKSSPKTSNIYYFFFVVFILPITSTLPFVSFRFDVVVC